MQQTTKRVIPSMPLADLRAKLSRIENDVKKIKQSGKKDGQDSPPDIWPMTMKTPYL